MAEKDCIDYVNWGGKPHSKVSGTISRTWVLSCTKRRNLAVEMGSPLSSSWHNVINQRFQLPLPWHPQWWAITSNCDSKRALPYWSCLWQDILSQTPGEELRQKWMTTLTVSVLLGKAMQTSYSPIPLPFALSLLRAAGLQDVQLISVFSCIYILSTWYIPFLLWKNSFLIEFSNCA